MSKYTNLPRLYLKEELSQGRIIDLSDESTHYLTVVLRMKPGETLRVFNPEKGEHLASVENISKKKCTLIIGETLRDTVNDSSLSLIFCPLRKERMHFLIEKSIELGVTDLYPILTERTQYRSFNLERAKKHIIEATEQCERISLARINPLQTLPNLLENWPINKSILMCKERNGSQPLAQTLVNKFIQDPAFLVGPEGGLTTEESILLESYSFVQPVSLGLNILRSETAALSALGFWQMYIKAQKFKHT
jgi:16S rRNA (uracil1498-N3)-methyltransferase